MRRGLKKLRRDPDIRHGRQESTCDGRSSVATAPHELGVVGIGARRRASNLAAWQVPDRVALTVTALGSLSLAVAVVVAVIRADLYSDVSTADRPMLAFLGLGLFVGETSRRCWIRSGPNTYVTPVHLFAFGLLLVGSPTGAVWASMFGTVAHALVVRATPISTLIQLSKVALTVGSAASVSMWLDASWSMDSVAGVSIAIDDFGTGYSSFETLRQLPVDRVKIDAVFVRGLLSNRADRVIVESVVDLAHRLGFDVVAEGLETSDTWYALAALGCEFAQGFGIARPMPLADLRPWLRSRAVVIADPLPRPVGSPMPAPRVEPLHPA